MPVVISRTVGRTDNIKHRKHKKDYDPKTILKCKTSDCDFKASNQEQLKIHNERIHRRKKNEKISCDECKYEKFFFKQKDRLKHYKEEHPGKTIFKCDHCKYGANYLPNLRSHINSSHEKKVRQCTKCSYTTTSNTLYHQHMRSEHGMFQRNSKYNVKGTGPSLLCQECGYTTFSQIEFKKHESKCSVDASSRSSSKASTKRQPAMRRHITISGKIASSSISKFKCNNCDYISDYPGNIRDHVRSTHNHQV